MIPIKTAADLDKMRHAGKVLQDVLALVKEHAKAGITTRRLDAFAYEYIKRQNCTPSFLGYNGFPASLCLSIDNEVVHGIPSGRVLEEGMLLKVDAGVCYQGYHADAARSIAIGKISSEKAQIARVCEESFFEGLAAIKEGARLGDVSARIQRHAEQNGYSVIRELVGHGIGTKLHEDPNIPNYGIEGRGSKMLSNMVFAIEPMINMGTRFVRVLDDNWTIVTADGKPSAHYENTVVVTPEGYELLTL